MHPNTMQITKTWVQGPMGWIRCFRWEKSRRDFVARPLALIILIHPILHRVSCVYEMIPNATHQNMSLGSNGVDWVRSLQKILTWLRATYFSINCTNSLCFGPSLMELRNDTKCTQTLNNAPKHEFRVQCGGLGAFVKKIPMWLHGTNFCINCTSSHYFAPSFMELRNDPKCTQTLNNAPKHEFRVQWGGLGAFIAKNPDVTSWHELLH